jgi:hypothetical protein
LLLAVAAKFVTSVINATTIESPDVDDWDSAMITAGYIFCWLFAQIAAFAVGTGSHYWHAHLSMPEKLIDGFRWRDHALNNALNNNYVWWGDYDEMGFWEFYSLKNYLSHVVPLSFIVFLFAIAYFPDRAEIVTKVCRGVSQIGMQPLFCM